MVKTSECDVTIVELLGPAASEFDVVPYLMLEVAGSSVVHETLASPPGCGATMTFEMTAGITRDPVANDHVTVLGSRLPDASVTLEPGEPPLTCAE